jgi:hypothetical protein
VLLIKTAQVVETEHACRHSRDLTPPHALGQHVPRAQERHARLDGAHVPAPHTRHYARLIVSPWVSRPRAPAGQLQPRRLNTRRGTCAASASSMPALQTLGKSQPSLGFRSGYFRSIHIGISKRREISVKIQSPYGVEVVRLRAPEEGQRALPPLPARVEEHRPHRDEDGVPER